jgi:hypothetical protein
MKILFWLVYINAAQNGIQDITPYLKELKERELNNEMPYSVDEVFEIFENELGIDLEEILKEHRKVSLRLRRDGKNEKSR